MSDPELVATVIETANEAIREAEITEEIATATIEAANERLEQANEMAADITLAAINTELGRRVTALEEKVELWHTSLSGSLEVIQAEVRNLMQINTLIAELEAEELEAAKTSSTLPTSEVTPGLETPQDKSESTPVETTAKEKPRRKGAWV